MHAFVAQVDYLRPAGLQDAPKMLFTLRGDVKWTNGRAGQPLDSPPAIDEAYFCSEVVVELFRRCGLVPHGIRSAAFWPADLSNGGYIDKILCGSGCALGAEQRIDFETKGTELRYNDVIAGGGAHANALAIGPDMSCLWRKA